jgi:hypothetical protein
MIHLNELKFGDIVNATFEGGTFSGSVLQIDRELRQVCVATNDDQESWYYPEALSPIPLTEDEVLSLQFRPDPNASPASGGITYVKGPFSIEVKDPATFQELVLLYRNEAPRIFHHGLALHELQNHYLQMTKVHLVDRADIED